MKKYYLRLLAVNSCFFLVILIFNCSTAIHNNWAADNELRQENIIEKNYYKNRKWFAGLNNYLLAENTSKGLVAKLGMLKGKAMAKEMKMFTIVVADFTDWEEAKQHTMRVSRMVPFPVWLEQTDHTYSIRAGYSARQEDLLPYVKTIKENGYPKASLSIFSFKERKVVLEVSPSLEIKRKEGEQFLEIKRKKQVGTGRVDLSDVEERLIESEEEATEFFRTYEGDYYIGKAWRSYHAGNFDQAIEFFNFAGTFAETEQDARLGVAYCYIELGKKEEALSLFDELVAERYKVKEIADVLVKIECFDKALELCNKVLFTDPFNIDFLILKINILVQGKNFDAVRLILASIPKDKNTLELSLLAADIEAWAKNYEKAIEKYQKLIRQFPEESDVWLGYLRTVTWAKNWLLLSDILPQGFEKVEMNDENRLFFVDAYLELGEIEKALDVWDKMDADAKDWSKSLLKIVDKYMASGKLEEATNLLKKTLATKKKDIHIAERLAINYLYSEVPEKGFEAIGQFQRSPETQLNIDLTRAELFALLKNYEASLSLLQTIDVSKDEGNRAEMVELECYYGLEKDEKLVERAALYLEKLSENDTVDRAKMLTLSVLSRMRIGQYKEAEKEIEILEDTLPEDYGPAILRVLLKNASKRLTEHDGSIQALGEKLAGYSKNATMVRLQLLGDEMLYDQTKVLAIHILEAWRIAGEVSRHKNKDIMYQLARAEYKAGNYQRSIDMYKQLYAEEKNNTYKIGMVECFLELDDIEKANELFDEIHLPDLMARDISRYFEGMLRLGREKKVFYEALSLIPPGVMDMVAMKTIILVAQLYYDNYEIAESSIKQYLTDKQEDVSIFRLIMARIGYFEKGEKGKCYEFVNDQYQYATERFPKDTGIRYEYAKHLASHREYEPAIEQHLVLSELVQDDYRVIRWLARLFSWTKQFDKGLIWYDKYTELRPQDIVVRHEIARVCGWALMLEEANEAYEKLCEDFPDNYELYWEWQAKRNNWLKRKRLAVLYYEKLVERHPEDAELVFDLGQLYSQLNFSKESEDTYRKLLVYEPDNTRATFAAESEKWRRTQSLGLKQTYIHQEGTGDSFGNFEITRFRTDLNYIPARLSEATDISMSLGHTIFNFTKHTGSMAEHVLLKGSKNFRNGIRTYLNGELSAYTENNEETIQFETGINYQIAEMFDTTMFTGREDVLENFVTLRNHRARYYTGGRFMWDINEHVDVYAQAKQYWYNDGNNGFEYDASVGYKFFVYPRILKFSVGLFGYDVRTNTDEYWSPNAYQKYSASLSWRHYLGKEHYAGAPEFFYEIAMKQSIDNDSIDFAEPSLAWGWDNKRRMNAGFEIKPMRSVVYDEERIHFFFNVRF
ncbi:MAG: tetratricopeptide repeat protein [Candidatus Kuenenia sp.]|nr:tetratricopeptide repeat protein [Candidatus Kuenenia hertensis]